MKSKFKHIYIKKLGTYNSKDTYVIKNNKSDDILGYISWYKNWNQYVFEAQSNEIIFSASCLQDICEFIESLKG